MTAATVDEPEPLTIVPGYLSIPAAAAELQVSKETIRRYIHQGVPVRGLPQKVRLRAYRVGRQYRVQPADLKAFVEAQNPDRTVELAGEAKRRQKQAAADKKALRKMLGKD